jgi:hypothetical protein
MVNTCKMMQKQVRASRRALIATQLLQTGSPLEHILNDLDASIKETLHTQNQAAEFLQQYHNEPTE